MKKKLDLNGIATVIARDTNGYISEDLRLALIQCSEAGLGDKPYEDTVPSEERKVNYGDEHNPMSLEADVILALRFKCGDSKAMEQLFLANQGILVECTKAKKKKGKKTWDECWSDVYTAYVECVKQSAIYSDKSGTPQCYKTTYKRNFDKYILGIEGDTYREKSVKYLQMQMEKDHVTVHTVTKEMIRDYLNMFPTRQIDIKVNEMTKHLNVVSTIVLPESSGVIYLEQELCEKAAVGVIDIGGLNVNCCVYNKTVPVLSTLYTDNLGSNVLMQDLKNALAIKYNEDIPDWMMEDVLTQGYLTDNMSSDGIRPGSKEFIREFKKNHINKIIQKCEANGWNLRTTRLIFSGGTSELLKEEIKSVLPGATILAEPAKANVRGFLKAVTE